MENLDELRTIADRALRENDFPAAHAAFARYLDVHPTDEVALVLAGEASRKMNNMSYVVEIYQRALEIDPSIIENRIEWVESLFFDKRTKDAHEAALEAAKMYPEAIRFRLQVAKAEITFGNFETAREILRECHKQAPLDVGTLFQMSQDLSPDDYEPMAKSLDELWARRNTIDVSELVTFGNARGRVMEKLKRYDDAFESYAFGAQAHRNIYDYDEMNTFRNLQMHQQVFGPNAPAVTEDPALGSNLIFIVSLPRSGSTLVEQILMSHSRVEAIGERSFVFEAFNMWYDNPALNDQNRFSRNALEPSRQHYLAAAREACEGDGAYIVDKSITNFLYLGFIRHMFPGAKFVHVVRDPLDVGFSCFVTPFYTGIEWSNNLAETGRMMRRYQKLQKQWAKQWPDHILILPYEHLVQNVEDRTRELLAFCGLDWEPACLDFHKSKRAVMTASVTQVRQPIYQTGRGRASHFEAHLAPLKAALGRAAKPDWYLK